MLTAILHPFSHLFTLLLDCLACLVSHSSSDWVDSQSASLLSFLIAYLLHISTYQSQVNQHPCTLCCQWCFVLGCLVIFPQSHCVHINSLDQMLTTNQQLVLMLIFETAACSHKCALLHPYQPNFLIMRIVGLITGNVTLDIIYIP